MWGSERYSGLSTKIGKTRGRRHRLLPGVTASTPAGNGCPGSRPVLRVSPHLRWQRYPIVSGHLPCLPDLAPAAAPPRYVSRTRFRSPRSLPLAPARRRSSNGSRTEKGTGRSARFWNSANGPWKNTWRNFSRNSTWKHGAPRQVGFRNGAWLICSPAPKKAVDLRAPATAAPGPGLRGSPRRQLCRQPFILQRFVNISPESVQLPAPFSAVLETRIANTDRPIASVAARATMLDAYASAFARATAMTVAARRVHGRVRRQLPHTWVQLRDAFPQSRTRPGPPSLRTRPPSARTRPTFRCEPRTSRRLQFFPTPAVPTSKHPNR
jgi:hypothetical protein